MSAPAVPGCDSVLACYPRFSYVIVTGGNSRAPAAIAKIVAAIYPNLRIGFVGTSIAVRARSRHHPKFRLAGIEVGTTIGESVSSTRMLLDRMSFERRRGAPVFNSLLNELRTSHRSMVRHDVVGGMPTERPSSGAHAAATPFGEGIGRAPPYLIVLAVLGVHGLIAVGLRHTLNENMSTAHSQMSNVEFDMSMPTGASTSRGCGDDFTRNLYGSGDCGKPGWPQSNVAQAPPSGWTEPMTIVGNSE
jgi:hypothetical protein